MAREGNYCSYDVKIGLCVGWYVCKAWIGLWGFVMGGALCDGGRGGGEEVGRG